ncbi:dimethyladenosine transferase [Rhodococcus spelaei]|uniref:Dimethyladenosine transferase n=1 Tax=Rhodococcus spelaei TaxID=2546320 RepID=A0A541AZB6_9NOCA|nr:SRPBCC family protein [Rhodococcus spelaei]TQF65407.1 dimethyladenosine transferase [Rhodococcus spelaei]
MASPIESVDLGRRKVARRAVIDAAAPELFAQVADPRRHADLDGSGTVKATVSGPERLALGDKFSVNMRMFGFPYRITSTVTAFEPDRLIEWRHPFGHRWRWEFDDLPAAGDDGPHTQVTEVFDYSTCPIAKGLELGGFPGKNGDGITATLLGLQRRYR